MQYCRSQPVFKLYTLPKGEKGKTKCKICPATGQKGQKRTQRLHKRGCRSCAFSDFHSQKKYSGNTFSVRMCGTRIDLCHLCSIAPLLPSLFSASAPAQYLDTSDIVITWISSVFDHYYLSSFTKVFNATILNAASTSASRSPSSLPSSVVLLHQT